MSDDDSDGYEVAEAMEMAEDEIDRLRQDLRTALELLREVVTAVHWSPGKLVELLPRIRALLDKP